MTYPMSYSHSVEVYQKYFISSDAARCSAKKYHNSSVCPLEMQLSKITFIMRIICQDSVASLSKSTCITSKFLCTNV